MKGIDFVLGLPRHGDSQERDDRIVKAVRDGLHAPLVYKPVTVKHRGLEARIWVMADALMVGEPGDYVRISMNADTAQRIAWEFGDYLPTTKICDAVWDAAEVKIAPETQGPPRYSYSDMDHPDRMMDYHKAVDRKIAEKNGFGKLIGNIGKHWVLTNKNTTSRAANYGWYVQSGGSVSASGKRMIQTLGTAHNGRHADYSQVLRLVKNEVEIDGKLYSFADVALDPELCGLVSSEGVLKSLYIPTAAAYKPADDQSYDGPDDRTPPDEPLRAEAPVRELVSTRLLYKGVAPGNDVGDWQRFLRVKADNRFGPVTQGATKEFQRSVGLVADGIVGPKTIAKANEVLRASREISVDVGSAVSPSAMLNLGAITFKQAKNYTWAQRKPSDIYWIVIHSMESSEKPTVAEAVANWFSGPDAPRASAHFNIDNDSIVQSVKVEQVAWHAPGANRHGIGLEHAGMAKQSRSDWFDEFSRAMLEKQSVPLCAYLCRMWGVPAEFVDRNGLRAGRKGVTTHHEVSQAFGKSTHWDPGPNFPMDWYLDRVRLALRES